MQINQIINQPINQSILFFNVAYSNKHLFQGPQRGGTVKG